MTKRGYHRRKEHVDSRRPLRRDESAELAAARQAVESGNAWNAVEPAVTEAIERAAAVLRGINPSMGDLAAQDMRRNALTVIRAHFDRDYEARDGWHEHLRDEYRKAVSKADIHPIDDHFRQRSYAGANNTALPAHRAPNDQTLLEHAADYVLAEGYAALVKKLLTLPPARSASLER